MYREGGPRIVLFGHRHAHTLGPPEMVAMYAPRAADIEQDKVKRVPMGQMGTARYVHDNVARQWRGHSPRVQPACHANLVKVIYENQHEPKCRTHSNSRTITLHAHTHTMGQPQNSAHSPPLKKVCSINFQKTYGL